MIDGLGQQMLESAEIGASVFGESQQPFPKSVDGDGNDRGGETFLKPESLTRLAAMAAVQRCVSGSALAPPPA